jgi:hypothetical protein
MKRIFFIILGGSIIAVAGYWFGYQHKVILVENEWEYIEAIKERYQVLERELILMKSAAIKEVEVSIFAEEKRCRESGGTFEIIDYDFLREHGYTGWKEDIDKGIRYRIWCDKQSKLFNYEIR